MKGTKKSLLISILSITLCVAMLLGTTYAWFTDSVQSGINTIQAGNLDVELYHINPKLYQAKKAAGETEPTPEKVDSNTELFTNVELWEPGAFAMEFLTVANEGDLALKYNLGINFDNETKVDGHGLSEALKVGIFDYDEEVLADLNSREDFIEYITEHSEWKNLASFNESGSLGTGENDSWSTKVYAIYWDPADNDNDFNMNNANQGKKLTIDLGVKLKATQLNSENDSFDNTYDMDATYDDGEPDPLVHVGTAADLEKAIKTFTGGETIVLEQDIDLNNENWSTTTPWAASGTELVFDGGGHTIKNLKTTGDNGGLFGKFNSNGNITIKDLILENVDLTGTNVDGESGGGALIGWSEVYGGTLTIENVTAKNVNIKDFKYIGGLVGYTSAPNNLNIKNCSVNGTELNCTYCEDGNNYKGHVGGIIGYYTAGTMSGCSASNLTIKGSTTANRAGALIGTAQNGVVVATGNSVHSVTINSTAVTAADQVIGSVDNRTDTTTNVTID